MLQAVSHEYTTRDIDAMVQKKHGEELCVCIERRGCVCVCLCRGGEGACVCVRVGGGGGGRRCVCMFV